MATSGNSPELLVDTSVAIALVLTDHEQHETTFWARALATYRALDVDVALFA